MATRVKKILVYIPIIIVVFIVVLYVLITSGFFLKNIGLPLVGKMIGTPISVESVDVSLIANPHIRIGGLILGSDKNPVITGKSIDLYFSVSSLLENKIKVTSCNLDNVNFNLHEGKDGSYNAPFLNKSTVPEVKKETSAPLKLPFLDLNNLKIINSSFSYSKDGDIELDIKNFNLSSDSIKTNSLSDLKISFMLNKFIADNVNIRNGSFNSNIKFELSRDYFPTTAQIVTYLKNFKGEIKGRDISNRSVILNIKSSLKGSNVVDISEASINEYNDNTLKSSLNVNGKIEIKPFNISLQFKADQITSNVINFIANTFLHKDLGDNVSLTMAGNLNLNNNVVSSSGQLNLNNASLPNAESKTQVIVNTSVSYNISSDLTKQIADIKDLHLSISNKDNEFLNLKTKSEVKINFSKVPMALESQNAEIELDATNFPMPLINAFLPNNVIVDNGILNSSLDLSMSPNNKDALLNGIISVSDLSANGPSFFLKNINFTQKIGISFVNLETIFIKELKTTVSEDSTLLFSLSVDGFYNLANGVGGLNVNIPQYSYDFLNIISDKTMPFAKRELLKKELAPLLFKIKTAINFSFNKDKNYLKVSKLSTDLRDKQGENIYLDLSEPFSYDAAKGISGDLKLKVSSEKLNINLFKGFIPETNRALIRDGYIFLNTFVSLDNNFKDISSYGNLGAKQLNIIDGKLNFKDVSTYTKYNVSINDNMINLKEFNLVLATLGRENLFVNLQEPLSITLKDFGFASKVKLSANIKNFSLPILNTMLPVSNSISKGVLSSDIMVSSSDSDVNDLNLRGKIDIRNLNASFNGQNIVHGNINSELDSMYNVKSGDMTVSKFLTFLACNNTSAGSVSFSGKLTDSYKNIALNVKFDLNKWLLTLLGKSGNLYQQIKQFSSNGEMQVAYNKSNLVVKGVINLPTLDISNQNGQEENINGKLSLDINKTAKKITISDSKANFFNNGKNIFDLTADGNIYFSKDQKSTINLNSNMVDIDQLLKVYNVVNPSVNVKEVTQDQSNNSEKEPSAIDLSNINMKGEISFKHIKYDMINLSLFSNVSIHNKAIEFYPLEIRDMTGGELVTNFYLNPSYSNGYIYAARGGMKNINLVPFIETFLKNDFNSPHGVISNSSWEIEGKGFTSKNLSRNLKGEVAVSCNSLSLPLNLSKNKLLALIFEPVRIFAGITNEIPNMTIPGDLNQAMSLASNLLNQNSNLNFSQGEILLKMYGGVTYINKFSFQGARNGIIRDMDFNGTIGPDSALNLMTDTSFGGIEIPMKINGTLDNPKPDYPDFIARFLTQNTKNLIQTTTSALGNIIQDAGNIKVRGGNGGGGGTIMEDVGSLLGSLTNSQ